MTPLVDGERVRQDGRTHGAGQDETDQGEVSDAVQVRHLGRYRAREDLLADVTIEGGADRVGVVAAELGHHEPWLVVSSGGGDGIEGDDGAPADVGLAQYRRHGDSDHGQLELCRRLIGRVFAARHREPDQVTDPGVGPADPGADRDLICRGGEPARPEDWRRCSPVSHGQDLGRFVANRRVADTCPTVAASTRGSCVSRSMVVSARGKFTFPMTASDAHPRAVGTEYR